MSFKQESEVPTQAILGDDESNNPTNPTPSKKLTTREKFNLLFLVLAFSCVVASLTLIVGTGLLL
jgi:hypothetical protein